MSLFLAVLFVAVFATVADAALTITPTSVTATLQTALTGNNVIISNVTLSQRTTGQIGIFSGGLTGGAGPVLGIADGIVMATGPAGTAAGPNTYSSISTGNFTAQTSDPDLALVEAGSQFDRAILQFNVVPAGNILSTNFAFGSDEYNEFVCSTFNDAMAIFISGPGIAGKVNIARLSTTGEDLSVNTVNRGLAGAASSFAPAPCNLGNSAFYVKNISDSLNEDTTNGNTPNSAAIQSAYTNLQYDGFTVPMQAWARVTPGQTYTIKIVIADIGDSFWDSAAFIDAINSYNLDLGDAPNSYGTQPINDTIQLPAPAAHATSSTVYLGSVASDTENTVTPATSPNLADNDDATGTDDEDAFGSTLSVNVGVASHTISNIPVNNGKAQNALLMGWIDFNKNGSFLDAGEFASASVTPGQTSANLSWSGFATTTAGTTYARFRITTDTRITASPKPVDFALDGEVEDYKVTIIAKANVLMVKRITAINGNSVNNPNDNTPLNVVVNDSTINDNNVNWPLPTTGSPPVSNFLQGVVNAGLVKPGDLIEYTVYFMNASGADATSVKFCDRILGTQQFLADAYGTGKDIEYRLGTTPNPVQYLTKASLASVDGAELNPSTSAIAGCPAPSISGTNNGTVVLDVTGNTGTGQINITALPGATAPGTPNNSYGYFRFKVKVDP